MNTDTPLIRVHTLGPPKVENNGLPTAVSRRQVRALLYYLASQPEPVPREQLHFLFWPDHAESEARRRLSIVLSHLRRTFLPIPLLVTAAESVQLNRHVFGSDLLDFHHQLGLAEVDEISPLEKAVDLYRGPFLEGFSLPDCPEYEKWLAQQRRHVEQDYLDTLMTLAVKLKESGDYSPAAHFAQAYLAVDELSEQAHRILIELYGAMDDRNRAELQFEECARVLERELGVRPLPETRTALDRALAGDPPPLISEKVVDPTTTLPGDQLAIIGRDEELNELLQTYTRLSSGKGKFVLLTGEAGVGKSFLARRFLQDHCADALVHSGECYPGEQQSPYQPILDALKPAIKRLLNQDSELPPWADSLYTFFPEMGRRSPASTHAKQQVSESPVGAWFDVFYEAIIHSRSETQPIVLYLEDLHWTDSATRAFLKYLTRRIKTIPMLILGCFRSEETEGLSEFRQIFSSSESFSELQLQGFDSRAAYSFLQVVSGKASFDPAIAERMHAITGGNPFFLLELLRSQGIERIENPAFDWGTAELPNTILQTMDTRLTRLSPHAQQVLETCAVLSKDLQFDWIRRIAGRSEMETIDSLDELQRMQILADEAGIYRFNHGVMRSAVYQSMSTWRRRLLHKRAGHELEVDKPNDFFVLAWHFERADPSFSAKAIDYLIQAADQARGVYAHQEAVSLYKRALTLLETSGEESRTARTWMKLGLVHQIAGDYHNAQSAYKAGFSLWNRPFSVLAEEPSFEAAHTLRMEWREPATLDPAFARDTTSSAIIDQLFRGLLELKPDLGLVPSIAESFELKGDGRRYTFKLRRDATWSDGVSVTSHDFVTAWKRVLDPQGGSPNASRLYDIKGARAYAGVESGTSDQLGILAPDDHTLVVELEKPCSYFPYLLSHHVTYPVPHHLIEKQGAQWNPGELSLSCGPFLLESWVKGQTIHLTRNPNYHGRFQGNVDQVLLTLDPNWKANLEAYEQDHLDVLTLARTSTENLVRARIKHSQDHISAPAFITTYLGFNLRAPPFDDLRVRKAIAHALDRQELASQVMQRTVFPAFGGFVPPGLPGSTDEIGSEYDLELAQDYLRRAGYPDGKGFPEVTLFSFPGSETRKDYLCHRLARDLNLPIRNQILEFETLLQKLDAHEADMFLIGWQADFPDPITFLRDCPFRIWTGWTHSEYEMLVSDASVSMETDTHIRLCQQADQLIINEAPIIPLNYSRYNLLVNPRVERFPPPVMGIWFFKDVLISPF